MLAERDERSATQSPAHNLNLTRTSNRMKATKRLSNLEIMLMSTVDVNIGTGWPNNVTKTEFTHPACKGFGPERPPRAGQVL